jgi:hypothetical protein
MIIGIMSESLLTKLLPCDKISLNKTEKIKKRVAEGRRNGE